MKEIIKSSSVCKRCICGHVNSVGSLERRSSSGMRSTGESPRALRRVPPTQRSPALACIEDPERVSFTITSVSKTHACNTGRQRDASVNVLVPRDSIHTVTQQFTQWRSEQLPTWMYARTSTLEPMCTPACPCTSSSSSVMGPCVSSYLSYLPAVSGPLASDLVFRSRFGRRRLSLVIH